jgi:hypothetical protein
MCFIILLGDGAFSRRNPPPRHLQQSQLPVVVVVEVVEMGVAVAPHRNHCIEYFFSISSANNLHLSIAFVVVVVVHEIHHHDQTNHHHEDEDEVMLC